MKVYLSGPMSGIPQLNLPSFEEAARKLRNEGLTVVSPIEEDIQHGIDKNDILKSKGELTDGPTWGECLARDIKTIADGGIERLYVLPGSGFSRGARLEIFLALLLKIPIYQYKLDRAMPPAEVLQFLLMSFFIGKGEPK